MTGAVLGAMIVAAAFVLIVGLTPILLVPIGLIVVGALFAAPLFAAMRESRMVREPGPSGVPTTGESSYDPVQQP